MSSPHSYMESILGHISKTIFIPPPARLAAAKNCPWGEGDYGIHAAGEGKSPCMSVFNPWKHWLNYLSAINMSPPPPSSPLPPNRVTQCLCRPGRKRRRRQRNIPPPPGRNISCDKAGGEGGVHCAALLYILIYGITALVCTTKKWAGCGISLYHDKFPRAPCLPPTLFAFWAFSLSLLLQIAQGYSVSKAPLFPTGFDSTAAMKD